MVRGPLFWTGWKPLHKALKEQRTKWDLVDVEKEPGRGASCRMKRPVAVGVCVWGGRCGGQGWEPALWSEPRAAPRCPD